MTSTTTQPPVPANPAATVILLRPSTEGFEVLLLLRAKAIKFAGGTWVFPGGRIDKMDGENANTSELDSLPAARVAAARESQEEAGLNLDLHNFLEYSHWTTPLAEPKRFSTWFLIGDVDQESTVTVDNGEIVEYQWLSPDAALKKHRTGDLKIMPPTYLTLLELAKYSDIEKVRQWVQSRPAPRYLPNMIAHDNTVSTLYQDDAGYAQGNVEADGRQHRMTMIDKSWHYIQPSD